MSKHRKRGVPDAASLELAAERMEKMRLLLRTRHVIRGVELARALGVSVATVRRDLAILEKQGSINRVHGGAVLLEGGREELPFDDKADMAGSEKRSIARAAYDQIARRDTLYLDGGSTVLELARLLRDRSDLTVVTNSLRAAMELSGQGPRLILTGGEFRRRSQTMVGGMTRYVLERLHLDKAFMGTIGISPKEGMTTTEPDEALTKEVAMQRAKRAILLADRRKFDACSFARSGAIEDLDVVITDRMPESAKRAFVEKGVEVMETEGK